MDRYVFTTAAYSLALIFAAGSPATAGDGKRNEISFDMVVSAGAKTCLPNARARVKVVSTGTAEDMTIHASGLPANTDFDLFVIQVPKAPFGLSWYQADVQTDDDGEAVQHVRGNIHRCPRFRAGAGGLQWAIPRRVVESTVQSHTDVPPGALVRLAQGCIEPRLPRRRHAV